MIVIQYFSYTFVLQYIVWVGYITVFFKIKMNKTMFILLLYYYKNNIIILKRFKLEGILFTPNSNFKQIV